MTDPAKGKVSQAAADALWAAASSENNAIAWYRSPVYLNLQRGLIAALKAEYGLTLAQADKVMDIYSDLGPHDSASGGRGWGIASYVDAVLSGNV